MQITISVTGLDAAQARMVALQEGFGNFSGAFGILGEQLKMFYGQTVFNSQGTALGSRWASLSEPYASRKAVKWPGAGMLVQSGTMQQGFYDRITPNSLFIGNDTMTPNGKWNLFAIHQLGTKRAGRGRNTTIPARPMVGYNDAVETMIKTVFAADIAAKIEGTAA